MSTRFSIFSIVLPKTQLFISLKKSFSKLFFAYVLSLVLRSIYFFNHALSSNLIPWWIFVIFKPRRSYSVRNLGNTCFIGSVIQMFRASTTIRCNLHRQLSQQQEKVCFWSPMYITAFNGEHYRSYIACMPQDWRPAAHSQCRKWLFIGMI